jgi:hypothetical protein
MRRLDAILTALAAMAPLAHGGVPGLVFGVVLLSGIVLSLAGVARTRVKRRARVAVNPFGNPTQTAAVPGPERSRASLPS